MKYFGEPFCHIIDYDKGKEVFVFDEKGEFETEDTKIIDFMKKNKWFIKSEESKKEIPKEVKKENNVKSETIKKPKRK